MKFEPLPIKQDQNEHILLKTHCVVAVYTKQYQQTPDRKKQNLNESGALYAASQAEQVRVERIHFGNKHT